MLFAGRNIAAAILAAAAGVGVTVIPSSATAPQSTKADTRPVAEVIDPAVHAAEDFFGSTKLHVFELTINASDFDKMMPPGGRARHVADDAGSSSGYTKVPATLRFNGKDWGPLKVRYKGNSSFRSAPSLLKHSLELDFGDSDSRRNFFGMSQLNLNNNAFDPSQMRETLAYDVFRRTGVPAPRTAFAKVFITVPGQREREYAGLFTAVEEIDQKFFRERWKQKVGVLAKPEGLFGMPEFGSNWQDYVEPYSIRVTKQEADVARLAEFVRFLNRASNDEFARRIDEYLDVDEFLRFLAAEVLIVNTDSPLSMDHNYWLTVHPQSHKIIWIPWDMNESFGGFARGDQRLSIHRPSSPGRFPLADRLLANPKIVNRYDAILRDMLATHFTLARLETEMRRIAAAIREAVANDRTLDTTTWDANFIAPSSTDSSTADEDFNRFDRFWGHKGPPLLAFIGSRIEDVRGQLGSGQERTPTR